MIAAFSESDARIESNLLERDADFGREIKTLLEIMANLIDRVFVLRILLHGRGSSLHMHEDHSRLRTADDFRHLPVSCHGGDVINHMGAGRQTLTPDLRLRGIDRQGKRRLPGESLDYRYHPAKF